METGWPTVRYTCKVTQVENWNDFWGECGFAYYQILRQACHVRVLATDGVALDRGRWAAHLEDFTRVLPGRYVNVVCGDKEWVLGRWVDTLPNIAITSLPGEGWNRAERKELDRRYHKILLALQRPEITHARYLIEKVRELAGVRAA